MGLIYSALCPLGIEELDRLLGGGVPRGSILLAVGPPGSGKYVLALRFLHEGAVKYGEKGAYVSLLQPRSKFMKYTQALGMDFKSLESAGRFKYVDLTPQLRSEFTEMFLLSALSSLKAEGVDRVVIDGITVILHELETARARAAFSFSLCKLLQDLGATTMLLVDSEALTIDGGAQASAALLERCAYAVLTFTLERFGEYVGRALRITISGGTAVTVPLAVVGSRLRLLAPFPGAAEGREARTLKLTSNGRSIEIPAGAQVLVLYPHGGEYALDALLTVLKASTSSGLRTLLVSFTSPPEKLEALLRRLGVSDAGVSVEFVDPVPYSLADVIARVWEAVDRCAAELLVLHGLRTLMELHADEKPVKFIFLNSQAMRARGVTCISLYEIARPRERVAIAEFCDVVIRLARREGRCVARIVKTPAGCSGVEVPCY